MVEAHGLGDVGKRLLRKVEALDDGIRVNLALGLLFWTMGSHYPTTISRVVR